MSTLTAVKIEQLHRFRSGLLELPKDDLTPKSISSYWETKRDKLRAAGITDIIGRYVQTIADVTDVDALDEARDYIIQIINSTISSLNAVNVRSVLDALIPKVKDKKLSTLLVEFNAAKNTQPNLAAVGLRTIICLIIQENARLEEPAGALATRPDLMLTPMLRAAIEQRIFGEGETKLLQAFERQGLKEAFDNVVHKPGDNALISADDLSSLVENTVSKILSSLVAEKRSGSTGQAS
jgi:hypothetical protein